RKRTHLPQCEPPGSVIDDRLMWCKYIVLEVLKGYYKI
ncbi:hypothetical protein NPIL_204901, partial [Nephila pilipes]